MLEITMPHVNAWNAWYSATGNRPEGVPALREKVDAACRTVGRNPDEVERTVAILVRLADGSGRGDADDARVPKLEGSSEQIADALRAYAREGISHVQLILDPITEASIEKLAPVLAMLDRV